MVRVETDGGVAVITLDRPERRNAVDHATLLRLLEAQAAVVEAGARAVVLTGAPPAFSAGADLHGVERGVFAVDLGRVLRGFVALPVPVIAAVDGPALGAGTQLVSVCDLRVATPTSVFGVPAAKLGIAVDLWTVDRIVTEFGAAPARAMLLASETFTAERLHATGAIHRLGDLDDALGWADEIAELAPLSIATHKLGLELALSGGAEGADDDAYEQALERTWSSDDAAEGRAAFLERRRASFGGR
ncbi:MAG: enoyl-CoA hydratase [Ilumatobacter sp.]|nr:enoyl-CoA hydratase [Ilumatobacter sp.]